MTREEAITYFEDAKEYWESVSISTKTTHISAYEMAIEALEQPEQNNGKWIPIKTRPMDEDERKEWSEKLGFELKDYQAVIYTSPLPDDGQNVLICLRGGYIMTDTFGKGDIGVYFSDNYIDDVVAWMPVPKPWEGEE